MMALTSKSTSQKLGNFYKNRNNNKASTFYNMAKNFNISDNNRNVALLMRTSATRGETPSAREKKQSHVKSNCT